MVQMTAPDVESVAPRQTLSAADHAGEADSLLAQLRGTHSSHPERHFLVQLAQAHALTALALDVTQAVPRIGEDE